MLMVARTRSDDESFAIVDGISGVGVDRSTSALFIFGELDQARQIAEVVGAECGFIYFSPTEPNDIDVFMLLAALSGRGVGGLAAKLPPALMAPIAETKYGALLEQFGRSIATELRSRSSLHAYALFTKSAIALAGSGVPAPLQPLAKRLNLAAKVVRHDKELLEDQNMAKSDPPCPRHPASGPISRGFQERVSALRQSITTDSVLMEKIPLAKRQFFDAGDLLTKRMLSAGWSNNDYRSFSAWSSALFLYAADSHFKDERFNVAFLMAYRAIEEYLKGIFLVAGWAQYDNAYNLTSGSKRFAGAGAILYEYSQARRQTTLTRSYTQIHDLIALRNAFQLGHGYCTVGASVSGDAIALVRDVILLEEKYSNANLWQGFSERLRFDWIADFIEGELFEMSNYFVRLR